MSVINPVTYALVVLVIVALVAGLVVGMALAGTEILNPYTSQAKANEINQNTEYQAQVNSIDLENRRRELDERQKELEAREAEVAKQLAAIQTERAQLDQQWQDLETQRSRLVEEWRKLQVERGQISEEWNRLQGEKNRLANREQQVQELWQFSLIALGVSGAAAVFSMVVLVIVMRQSQEVSGKGARRTDETRRASGSESVERVQRPVSVAVPIQPFSPDDGGNGSGNGNGKCDGLYRKVREQLGQ